MPKGPPDAPTCDKRGDDAFKRGKFDESADWYDLAADKYLRNEEDDQAGQALEKEVGALIRGAASARDLEDRAATAEKRAKDLEAKAAAAEKAGKVEGRGGASEVYPIAAMARLKAGLLRKAAAIRLGRVKLHADAGDEAKAAAAELRRAAQDYERAADCDAELAERRKEWIRGELARNQAAEAEALAANAYRKAGDAGASAAAEKRALGDLGKAGDDFLNSTMR